MANPYAKPNTNRVKETGTSEKKTFLSHLLNAGLKKEYILKITIGKVNKKAQNNPISIDNSAN